MPPKSQMKRRPVILKPNDRYAFVGKSGSGKTLGSVIVASEIIPPTLQEAKGWEAWAIDTKDDVDDIKRWHEWGYEDWDPFAKRNLLATVTKRQHSPRRLIRVPFTENDPEMTSAKVQALCNRAMQRSCVLLVIDEYSHVCPSSRNAGAGLRHVFQRGRGRNVGIIGCTQEPVDVPRQLLSQASHIFLFALTYPNDIKRVQEIYRPYVPPSDFGFFHSWIDTPGLVQWQYYKNIGEWHAQLAA